MLESVYDWRFQFATSRSSDLNPDIISPSSWARSAEPRVRLSFNFTRISARFVIVAGLCAFCGYGANVGSKLKDLVACPKLSHLPHTIEAPPQGIFSNISIQSRARFEKTHRPADPTLQCEKILSFLSCCSKRFSVWIWNQFRQFNYGRISPEGADRCRSTTRPKQIGLSGCCFTVSSSALGWCSMLGKGGNQRRVDLTDKN